MNRIVYFLICVCAICSCAKDTEINTPTEGEPMQFSLGSISRLEQKNTWSENDQIAIYREDETEPRLYTVTNANGDLTSTDGWEYSYDYSNYRAIYPYEENKSYESYIEDLPTFSTSDYDYLIADYATAEDQYLELMFSHAYATLTIGDNTASYTVTATANGESQDITVTTGNYPIFAILAGDYTDNLTITVMDKGYLTTITPSAYIYEGGVNYNIPYTYSTIE